MLRAVIFASCAALAVGLNPTAAREPIAQADETDSGAVFYLGTFSADVTCRVGHPLLGGIWPPAREIVDPLYARGFVLLGGEQPIVLCAIDWCEIRNRSYDQWRDALARAAGTQRERVLVCCLHQHDAPLTDIGAAELLAQAGLAGKMFDPQFEQDCIDRTVEALLQSLKRTRLVTHLGVGSARVQQIASSRRVVRPDGSVTYGRGSNSGGNRLYRDASDGLIDPWLRTLSFWDRDQPIAALHAYATHPMSYYGQGGVSYDFVGMARDLFAREHPDIFQIYVSGCSGDVTAGKYNDGSPANRPYLARRLNDAMKQAWAATRKQPLSQVVFHNTGLELEFRPGDAHSPEALADVLHDSQATQRQRVLAAMGLASRRRIETGQPIDLACLDLGVAQIVLFPGEAFVGYQLMAQQQRPESFVVSIGYGECWPGYIPTRQGFEDEFTSSWYWVAPGSDRRMADALNRVLPRQ